MIVHYSTWLSCFKIFKFENIDQNAIYMKENKNDYYSSNVQDTVVSELNFF